MHWGLREPLDPTIGNSTSGKEELEIVVPDIVNGKNLNVMYAYA